MAAVMQKQVRKKLPDKTVGYVVGHQAKPQKPEIPPLRMKEQKRKSPVEKKPRCMRDR